MTDYNSLKVPELKKMLGDRSLPISGNKADLIVRLQDDDKKPTAAPSTAATAEDEIDWDEDESKATAPPATAIAAGGKGQVSKPAAVPNQKVAVDPAKTKDLKAAGEKDTPAPTDEAKDSAGVTTTDASAAPATEDAPKQDFAIGIKQTDAEKEAEKRAARAKRFGITENEEEKKKLDRAKKFGTDKELVTKGLDDALPERRAKRGREADKQGGRAAKRQTPDRRTEVAPTKAAATKAPPVPVKSAPAKKVSGRVIDDPIEKAKAEARAKRFQTAA